MDVLFRASLAAVFLLLSGCVTAPVYGPITLDQPFGYSEQKREDGSYILRVVHPDTAEAIAYWNRRAVELCGSSAYAKNIYQAARPMVMSPYTGMPGAAVFEGTLTCAPHQPEPNK